MMDAGNIHFVGYSQSLSVDQRAANDEYLVLFLT